MIMLYSGKYKWCKRAAFCEKTQDPGEPEIYAKNPSTTSRGSVMSLENSGRFTEKT